MTINAPDDWRDHAQLLDGGFSEFEIQRVIHSGEIVGFAEIAGGQSGIVQLLAADDFDYAVSSEEVTSLLLPVPGFVYAPVTEGADAGYAYVCVNGKPVGKVPVIYGETIEKIPDKKKSFFERLIGGD